MDKLSRLAVVGAVALGGCSAKPAKGPVAPVSRETHVSVVSQAPVDSITETMRERCSKGEISEYFVKYGCYDEKGRAVALRPRKAANFQCKDGARDLEQVKASVRSLAAECFKNGGSLRATAYSNRPGQVEKARKYAREKRGGRF